MKQPLGITFNVTPGQEATGVYESEDGIEVFEIDEPYLLSDGQSLAPPLPVKIVDGPTFLDSMGRLQSAIPVSGIGPAPFMHYNFCSAINSSQTFDGTLVQLVMLPVEYKKIRLVFPHFGGNGASVIKALIAATDNIGDLGLDNTPDDKRWVTPMRAGVENNTVSPTGWNRVLFGGEETLTIADPGSATLGDSELPLTAYGVSDWINLDAVALADESLPGYYALLIRFYGANGGANNYTTATVSGGLNSAQYIADQTPRIMRYASRIGDHVTTVGGWSQANTPTLSSNTFMPVLVQAQGDAHVKSAVFVGDSRFAAASGDTSFGYRRLEWYVEKIAVASGSAYTSCTVSQGGYESSEYLARALELLESGTIRPEWAVYLVYSINDGLPTEPVISAALTRAGVFKTRCLQLGIKCLFVTSFPRAGGFDSGQLDLLDSVESYAASNGPYISPLSLYGDASGDWAASWGYDSNHMTSAGYEDLASQIWEAIN